MGEAPVRQWSTRAFLVLLAAVVLLPPLAFSGFLLWRFAESETENYQFQALAMARRLSTAVDRELAAVAGTLQALATSPLIASGDYAQLYEHATEVKELIGSDILFKRADGQQIVNTRHPWGAKLPVSLPDADRKAIEFKRTTVSNLFNGATAKRPIVSINVPVIHDGELAGLINASIVPDRLARLIAGVDVPPDWTAAIVDGNDRIVARNRRHEQFVGTMASDDLREKAIGPEGVWTGWTKEGTPVLAAHKRSNLANWRVAVGVPVNVVEAPLRRSLMWLLAIGALSLTFTAALVSPLARRLTRSLEGLADRARHIAHSGFRPLPASGLREIDDVAMALSASSARLNAVQEDLRTLNESLERQVAERTRELVASNDKLRAEILYREDVEEQLRHAQKLEALGQLTGGIAHDFNNLLAVIHGSLYLMRKRLRQGDTEAANSFADSAVDGAERAGLLTARLLAFSRKQTLTPGSVNANTLIRGITEFLQRTLGETVRIETMFADDLWTIRIDQSQLENALVNLGLNARDAMPEGGRLIIQTSNRHLDENAAAAAGLPAVGDYVVIAVSDTGIGMSSDILDRAFEPFFTTKETGKGTGLGLSQVYGFTKQSGGQVQLSSEPGQGTCVTLYFPRFDGAADAQGASVEPDPKQAAPTDGIILVVEDEDDVRRIHAESLRDLGYRVLEADGAVPALRLLDAHSDVSLLFTDIVMPGINGRKLAEEARNRFPQIKILFTTGYSRDTVLPEDFSDPAIQLITKPFTIERLDGKVREMLDADPLPPAPSS